MKGALVSLAMLVGAGAFLAGCSDPDGAKRVLAEQGYSQIETDGFDWFACPKDDTYATAFVARGPNGLMVHGTVCRGFFFGSHIRVK